MKKIAFLTCLFYWVLSACTPPEMVKVAARPNILIAISDDQSWIHAGAYGSPFVRTPAFDSVARKGVLFANAIAPSPGCAPSRGALALGRYPWQNGRAGNHQSLWPEQYTTLADRLRDHGYHTGFTGKGVGPFFWALGGRETDPAGEEYNLHRLDPPFDYISDIDYAANFQHFLESRPDGEPFYFWYGAHEPHRWFQRGAGEAAGKEPSQAVVPSFLPDAAPVRTDLLDYANEIEWFDRHLGRMIEKLKSIGELENTIIIVTSDNGMAFPAAKANCREYGIHVPLAVRWDAGAVPGRVVDDLISFVDILPTIAEATELQLPDTTRLAGKSFLDILRTNQQGQVDLTRTAVFSGRERHSSSRYYNLSYPARAIRTQDHLLIWNCRPERWPAGAPVQIVDGQEAPGFTDVDWTSEHNLSMLYLVDNGADSDTEFLRLNALGKRPEFELYDIRRDPGCLKNLAGTPEMDQLRRRLTTKLMDYLKATEDPRLDPARQHEFESHRRYAGIRQFPPPDWTTQIGAADLIEIKLWADKDTEPVVPPVAIGDWGVQTDRWRLVHEESGWQLFDVKTDPDLHRDLASIKRSTVGNLVKYFNYWRGHPE